MLCHLRRSRTFRRARSPSCSTPSESTAPAPPCSPTPTPINRAGCSPGGLPGRPARDALYRALRPHLPIHLHRARSAALAALATDLPAAVLANLLDLNINTANAWAVYAQYDWTTYLAARTRAQRSP